MNNTMTLKDTKGMLRIGFISWAVAIVVMLLVSLIGIQSAHAAITSSLDLGSTGSNVTQLQTYLATNSTIYPSGLVTGFFGPLTEAAVQRFQTAQGIVTSGTPETTGYGRVGPMTMARLNGLMASSGGNNVTWDTVPVQSNPSILTTNTTATWNWTTNEPTLGEVYWSIAALQSDEATGPNQKPYISGALAVDAGGQQTNHSVTVSNLQPNTPYNYIVRSTDTGGNETMTLSRFLRTNN